MESPKTIITYLVDWNPTGIKTVELSNRVGKAIIIPRSKIKEAKERPETKQPAIYFLFWEDSEGNRKAYIWEAENLMNRISNHDTNKDFWDTVVAFISKDNNLTKADVKFLEANAIEKGLKIKRFEITNTIEPIPNNLPEYQESTMKEFLQNIDLLISAIGYPLLKEVVSSNIRTTKIYYLPMQGCDAKWEFIDEGFLILKGSLGRLKEVDSFWGKAKTTRTELLERWILSISWEHIVFNADFVSSSPSHAASLLSARPTNGWKERKDAEGKTLDENERKSLST